MEIPRTQSVGSNLDCTGAVIDAHLSVLQRGATPLKPLQKILRCHGANHGGSFRGPIARCQGQACTTGRLRERRGESSSSYPDHAATPKPIYALWAGHQTPQLGGYQRKQDGVIGMGRQLPQQLSGTT